MAIKEILEGNTSKVLEATELLKVLGDREGQFVWVKYETETLHEITVTNPSFVMTAPANGTPGTLNMRSITGFEDYLDDIDLMFFDGFTGRYNSMIRYTISWDSNWNTMFLFDESIPDNYSRQGTALLDYADGVLSIKSKQSWARTSAVSATMTYSGTKTISLKTPKIVPTIRVGYVFSDDVNAYPNGDIEDGYWYQLVPVGSDCVECGEITVTGSMTSITVAHSLGLPPSYVTLVPKKAFSVSSTADILYAVLNETVLYSKFFSGSGSYGLTTGGNTVTSTDTNITFKSSKTIRTGDYYWVALAKERGIRQ